MLRVISQEAIQREYLSKMLQISPKTEAAIGGVL